MSIGSLVQKNGRTVKKIIARRLIKKWMNDITLVIFAHLQKNRMTDFSRPLIFVYPCSARYGISELGVCDIASGGHG